MTEVRAGAHPHSKRTADDDRLSEWSEDVVTMADAVGYAAIPCERETPVSDALAIKHDRLFLLTDQDGNITPPGNCSLGLFEDDTRILSHYELRAAGTPMAKLSSQVVAPYWAQIDLAVTDHAFGGNAWDPKHAIYLRRELVVEDSLIERLTLTNFLIRPIDYWIELRVGCDFADIFEVRGWKRDHRGVFMAPTVAPTVIRYAYRGRDGKLMESVVSFRQEPDTIDRHCARWRFQLKPGTPILFAMNQAFDVPQPRVADPTGVGDRCAFWRRRFDRDPCG